LRRPPRLPAVTVTATGHEEDALTAPASVTVIDREHIQNRASDDLLDAVQDTPGLSLSPRQAGGRKTFSLRGMNDAHTLMLVDGRRISATDDVVGHSDYQYGWVPMSAVERVEVIRGPLSALYGSEALGGVVNVITGKGSRSGQYILDHPGFRKLAFTGSTEVGLSVAKAAANRLIPATLELGGKSGNIFFDDCDFDQAIDGLQLGILFNQGQVCCAGSRVFVQEGIYDSFVAAAVDQFNKVRIGDPLDPKTQLGAQINEAQARKVQRYIDIARKEGATIACGGTAYTEGACAQGVFFKPTLITDIDNTKTCSREEIFGPVAVVIKFRTEDEVIAMANDSDYGLGGGVWTRDLNRAIRVSRAIETGRVWINTYNQIPAGAPFGGYKQSGIGRETHKVILEHYTQQKNIMINLNEAPSGFYPQS